jgi:hypothetical protein
MRTAAAPSFIPEAFPAVTVHPFESRLHAAIFSRLYPLGARHINYYITFF